MQSLPASGHTYDLLNRQDTASAIGGEGQGLYNENHDCDSQGNQWKKGTVGSETVYTYLDGAHKHAVTHLGGVQKHWYDANGNMTTPLAVATTYIQGWDAENRVMLASAGGLRGMPQESGGMGVIEARLLAGSSLLNNRFSLTNFMVNSAC